MSKYLHIAATCNHSQRSHSVLGESLPGHASKASALVAVPLLVGGSLLLAAGMVDQGIAQAALGLIGLAAGVTLLTPRP